MGLCSALLTAMGQGLCDVKQLGGLELSLGEASRYSAMLCCGVFARWW